eukprot:s2306_g7.t1
MHTQITSVKLPRRASFFKKECLSRSALVMWDCKLKQCSWKTAAQSTSADSGACSLTICRACHVALEALQVQGFRFSLAIAKTRRPLGRIGTNHNQCRMLWILRDASRVISYPRTCLGPSLGVGTLDTPGQNVGQRGREKGVRG